MGMPESNGRPRGPEGKRAGGKGCKDANVRRKRSAARNLELPSLGTLALVTSGLRVLA